jgi:hypothetical protein
MQFMSMFRVTFRGLLTEADAEALSKTAAHLETPHAGDEEHAVTLSAPNGDEALWIVKGGTGGGVLQQL